MKILSSHDLELIINLTLKINLILKSFFKNIQLQLVDFKLEFGYDSYNNIILGDEISRSEEHTSELQSLVNLVCRLLLEKKKHS